MSTTAMRQEFFQVSESKRSKILRQDRVQMPTGLCFVQFESDTYELFNVSPFGCAILCTQDQISKLDVSQIYEAKLIFDNIEIQEFKVKIARSMENLDQKIILLGLEVISEPIKVERLSALLKTKESIVNVISYSQQIANVPISFKALIYDMKDILLRLKSELDKIENNFSQDDKSSLMEYELTVAESTSMFLNSVIPNYYNQIPDHLKNLEDNLLKICTVFAREQLGFLIYGAPFANRAYFKPRGYAGDYEMMNHLYRNETVGRTLFDKCMHKYLVDEPAAVAVKNRGHYLHEKIRGVVEKNKGKLKILAVASGPALEIQLFLKNNVGFRERDVEFTCIDQDEESLKHAQLQIMSLSRLYPSSYKFNFKNLAIRDIIVNGLPSNDYDLIYTAGLFDYFTDPVAQLAASKLVDGLKIDGELIIGNFSKNNPTQILMEMFLDWNLIYRSETEMLNLFSKVCKKAIIEKEPLGINLFACLKK